MYDLAILNGQLYIDKKYISSNIYIKDGKIKKISKKQYESKNVYDATNRKVFPGFIDPHVHFELDLGKYKSCDDFYNGSICAAYGGVTTFIDFLEPISNANQLESAYKKRRELAKKSVVDFMFHATVCNPIGQVEKIVNKMKQLNMHSVKLFTTYKQSNRRTYDNEIIELLKLSKNKDILVLAHIENDDLINIDKNYTIKDLPLSRSSEAEINEAIKLAKFTKKYDGNLYMVHLSSGNTLKKLLNGYKDIINKSMYIESCPHYFTFNNELYNSKNAQLFAIAPPLRSKEEVRTLRNLFDNINTIGTDHCSFNKDEKLKEKLIDIPMGVGGIEHSFNIMYNMYKEKAIDKMTINPAKIFDLYPNKGTLEVDTDADIVIYNPDIEYKISKGHTLSDYTIYEGQTLKGQIESTILRGNFVIKNREFLGGIGKCLR